MLFSLPIVQLALSRSMPLPSRGGNGWRRAGKVGLMQLRNHNLGTWRFETEAHDENKTLQPQRTSVWARLDNKSCIVPYKPLNNCSVHIMLHVSFLLILHHWALYGILDKENNEQLPASIPGESTCSRRVQGARICKGLIVPLK